MSIDGGLGITGGSGGGGGGRLLYRYHDPDPLTDKTSTLGYDADSTPQREITYPGRPLALPDDVSEASTLEIHIRAVQIAHGSNVQTPGISVARISPLEDGGLYSLRIPHTYSEMNAAPYPTASDASGYDAEVAGFWPAGYYLDVNSKYVEYLYNPANNQLYWRFGFSGSARQSSNARWRIVTIGIWG